MVEVEFHAELGFPYKVQPIVSRVVVWKVAGRFWEVARPAERRNCRLEVPVPEEVARESHELEERCHIVWGPLVTSLDFAHANFVRVYRGKVLDKEDIATQPYPSILCGAQYNFSGIIFFGGA